MHLIHARNVNDAYAHGVKRLRLIGELRETRNGPALVAPCPVTTVYRRPMERVLFCAERDANPFFHIVESAWMIAGRDDLKSLTSYARNMVNYSDDGGVTQPGAYGRRWRGWFHNGGTPTGEPPLDQLCWVVKKLRTDPNDRRVVIQMWDAEHDPRLADIGGKDVPCNLTALPYVSGGALHLTVFCRSNDIVWGAYGANAVHFSMLLEYLAGRLGLPVGTMTQVSNNWHAYVDTLPAGKPSMANPYEALVNPAPVWDWGNSTSTSSVHEKQLREDLLIFFDHGPHEAVTKARWPWVRHVLAPMALAHQHWKTRRGPERYDVALEIMERVQAEDWQMAGRQWLLRRQERYRRAADDGVRAVP